MGDIGRIALETRVSEFGLVKNKAKIRGDSRTAKTNRCFPFIRISPSTSPRFFLPDKISKRVDFPEEK